MAEKSRLEPNSSIFGALCAPRTPKIVTLITILRKKAILARQEAHKSNIGRYLNVASLLNDEKGSRDKTRTPFRVFLEINRYRDFTQPCLDR
ncbi:hypothetical protein [Bifidobacterium sp. ESL0732]|uniref:hypothetical protein n=1 Tax=Bifidobacterium sp. ESL0732 TaxID=2983222 RepID=UPI0023F6187A|nr:hypothetical protein [Bifidobacterium sp. ESL0732]WEV64598.1 hypothetical protein OZX70_03205 [Bifidobacterium sp. ESL0732]